MELTMSMFATKADYWESRAKLAAAAFEREQARADAAEVRAELAEKDAERYRWLAAQATQQADSIGPIFRIDVRRRIDGTPFSLTAAIDAAMALHNARIECAAEGEAGSRPLE